MTRILCVCGTRPNFIKIAPIIRAFNNRGSYETLLVHTGQHYDINMSKTFFDALSIPAPDINLNVGANPTVIQTADIMRKFEPVVLDFEPDYILVTGDVNSTLACGLVAVQTGVKLIHVEAGQRSFDWAMPEEMNRIVIDSVSDMLFVSERSGLTNLRNEGIPDDKIFFVGNVMIDTLMANLEKAMESDILERLNLCSDNYGVLTMHRQSNVNDHETLSEITHALEHIQKQLKLVFPVHPRTVKCIEDAGLSCRFQDMENLIMTDALGYHDFLCLMSKASIVITDSGGIQEESAALNTPCLTLRDTTEWPGTVESGYNRLAGTAKSGILRAYTEIMNHEKASIKETPEYWDGKAAERIADIVDNLINPKQA